MKSFNAFQQKKAILGGNIPVWLGVVSPLPIGGTLPDAYAFAGASYPAGAPIYFDEANKAIYPFVAWEVAAVDSTTHTITVKGNAYGILPEVNDFLCPVGAKFDTTGAADKVKAIAANAAEGKWDLTINAANLDGVSVGSFLTLSSATAAASSGKAIKYQPNAYLYNDIRIEALEAGESYVSKGASGAVVNFHGEGILIDRTAAAPFKTQMAAAVPCVNQIAG